MGQLYQSIGTSSFHIVEEKFIYFYSLVQDSDGEYSIEHLKTISKMFDCNGFVLGNKGKRTFSFTEGMPGIRVNRRKYFHSLSGCIDDGNFGNTKCIDLASKECFVIVKENLLMSYCSICMKKIQSVPLNFIPYEENKYNYQVQVLSLEVSKDQKYLALLTGVVKVKEIEELKQLIVYQITDNIRERFKLILDYYLPPEFSNYAKKFTFNYRKDRKSERSILLIGNT